MFFVFLCFFFFASICKLCLFLTVFHVIKCVFRHLYVFGKCCIYVLFRLYYCLVAIQISLGTINVKCRVMSSKEPNRTDSVLQVILDINIVLSFLIANKYLSPPPTASLLPVICSQLDVESSKPRWALARIKPFFLSFFALEERAMLSPQSLSCTMGDHEDLAFRRSHSFTAFLRISVSRV